MAKFMQQSQNIWYHVKGLSQVIHVKYESPTSYGLNVTSIGEG